jgi:hypothetical protein
MSCYPLHITVGVTQEAAVCARRFLLVITSPVTHHHLVAVAQHASVQTTFSVTLPRMLVSVSDWMASTVMIAKTRKIGRWLGERRKNISFRLHHASFFPVTTTTPHQPQRSHSKNSSGLASPSPHTTSHHITPQPLPFPPPFFFLVFSTLFSPSCGDKRRNQQKKT